MTAAEKILGKALVGSGLDTKGWSGIQAGLRDRAFFSSQVEDARILHAARQMCAEVAEGRRSASEFRRDMRTLLAKMGHPEGDGSLKDLYSDKRLDVLRDTNVKQARGYAQWLEGTKEGALMAFPAQELVRVEARIKTRDWKGRWSDKGGKFYQGRMIAMKNDPIWERISRFGSAWPPFDFNSGMGVEDVSLEEAIELGVMGEDDPTPTMAAAGFNDGLEAEVEFDGASAEWKWLKKQFGDQIQLDGGKVKWRGEIIRENFEEGGHFTMRLGEASDALLGKLGAKAETSGFAKAMQGQGQLTVTQDWLERKREDGSDHRAHFTYLPDYPDSKPLTIGDIELIPSIWRNPDRVYDADRGCIALEIDAIEGDVFRLIVKVGKDDGGKRKYPDVKTFYRTSNRFSKNEDAAFLGPSGASRTRRLTSATTGRSMT